MASLIPAFAGMLTLALLPKDGLLWLRWGMYLMTVTGNLPGLRKSRHANSSSSLTISSDLDNAPVQRGWPHEKVCHRHRALRCILRWKCGGCASVSS